MDNIESVLGKDLSSLLKEAMENKFNFKESQFHPAKVVENDDPEQLGRVSGKR